MATANGVLVVVVAEMQAHLLQGLAHGGVQIAPVTRIPLAARERHVGGPAIALTGRSLDEQHFELTVLHPLLLKELCDAGRGRRSRGRGVRGKVGRIGLHLGSNQQCDRPGGRGGGNGEERNGPAGSGPPTLSWAHLEAKAAPARETAAGPATRCSRRGGACCAVVVVVVVVVVAMSCRVVVVGWWWMGVDDWSLSIDARMKKGKKGRPRKELQEHTHTHKTRE